MMFSRLFAFLLINVIPFSYRFCFLANFAIIDQICINLRDVYIGLQSAYLPA